LERRLKAVNISDIVVSNPRMSLQILLLIAGLCWAFPLANAAVTPSATKARLVLSAESVRPGDTVLAGVHLKMDRGWHVYWRNAGESGLPTRIEWTLPAGIRAGEIQWPVPEVFTSGGLTTYVYQGETLLIVPLKVTEKMPRGSVQLRAKVSWLECQEACVPGSGEVEATLLVGAETKTSSDAGLIETWQKRTPASAPASVYRGGWAEQGTNETRHLIIEGEMVNGAKPSDFYGYGGDGFEVSPGAEALEADAGKFRLRKSVKRFEPVFPSTIEGVLVWPGSGAQATAAREVRLDLGSASKAAAGVLAAEPISAGLLWKMMALAFLGGLILNVMPCVLPVIALKILGFVQQSKEAPARVRRLGLVYALGVLVSFLVLAGMVIAVRQAGGAASWGMQMQNPFFRLALTVAVTLVALNLFGVFEVTLGGGTLGAAAGLASKEGSAGAFFNGVLATALATPCTAPFLTVALGFAFTQPAWVVLIMFVATAAGLALPYVVLSWRPGWLKFLPRPGVWMQQFRVAMGFPMLATGVWLFDVTVPTFGEDGVLWLGLLLVVVALTAWVWGEFVQRGTKRRGVAMATCFALGLCGIYLLEGQLHWRTPAGRGLAPGVGQGVSGGIEWQPWSPAAVAKARGEGRPVLVDFTARWCLTCKSNKRFAVEIPSVTAKLKEVNAVALRADNTDPSPAITEELRRYNRAGVPLVLVFPRQADKPAIVLPALLTPSIVLDALAEAER